MKIPVITSLMCLCAIVAGAIILGSNNKVSIHEHWMLVWSVDIKHPDGTISQETQTFDKVYGRGSDCYKEKDELESQMPIDKIGTDDGGVGISSYWKCIKIPFSIVQST